MCHLTLAPDKTAATAYTAELGGGPKKTGGKPPYGFLVTITFILMDRNRMALRPWMRGIGICNNIVNIDLRSFLRCTLLDFHFTKMGHYVIIIVNK
jgi:hypothetical protein